MSSRESWSNQDQCQKMQTLTGKESKLINDVWSIRHTVSDRNACFADHQSDKHKWLEPWHLIPPHPIPWISFPELITCLGRDHRSREPSDDSNNIASHGRHANAIPKANTCHTRPKSPDCAVPEVDTVFRTNRLAMDNDMAANLSKLPICLNPPGESAYGQGASCGSMTCVLK